MTWLATRLKEGFGMWLRAAWFWAPPLVMPAAGHHWRMAPTLRLLDPPAPPPVAQPRTDPALVAARRASFRLVAGLDRSMA